MKTWLSKLIKEVDLTPDDPIPPTFQDENDAEDLGDDEDFVAKVMCCACRAMGKLVFNAIIKM